MSSTFWLAAGDAFFSDAIDFSADDMAIPVVMLQTGAARAAVYPGVFRSARIRTYADKFGTPTTLTDAKEITFSALVYGKADEVYYKWQRINSFLDRAQMAASPFPRGTGVVWIEQLNDANEITIWDVQSGVLNDIDMNIPDSTLYPGIIQLTVLPFSRGRPRVAALGSTLTNGTNSGFYIPYQGGDAPGLFELRLSDKSASGHYITWVALGRRWYPKMGSGEFTPWYPESSSIVTSTVWQQILSQVSAGGKHDTGLFGVYAIVNDASPVIGQPTGFGLVPNAGGGSIPNSVATVVLVPRDVAGAPGAQSPRVLATLFNPAQPGDVQDYEGFEDGTFNAWSSPPSFAIAAGGSASLSIDAAAALAGRLGAHFKVTGNSTASSITSAAISRFGPGISGLGQQSVAYQVYPKSWGSSGASSTPVTDPTPAPTVSAVSGGVGAPAAPTVFDSGSGGGPASGGILAVGYTWVNGLGETTISPVTGYNTNGNVPNIIIPPFPAGVTAANIYSGFSGPGSRQFNFQVRSYGTYFIIPWGPGGANPPTTDTTGSAQFPPGTYDFGYTWLTANGETKITPLATLTFSTPGSAAVTIPAFPATVTGANVYASAGASGATVYLAASAGGIPGRGGVITSPGVAVVGQGDGVTLPPAANTTGTGAHDSTSRFTWGSLQIQPAGPLNYFAMFVNGAQIGSAFLLAPNVLHSIGASFQQFGLSGVYSLVVDGTAIGRGSGVIGTAGFSLPITAQWMAVGAGTNGPFTEEYYLDEIYFYDAVLEPGFSTTGSSLSVVWANGANTITIDAYFQLRITGVATPPVWYRLPAVASPLLIGATFPPGAQLVAGPPVDSPQTSFAQLQAQIGAGSAPSRFLPKRVVRTALANGIDELVRLDSIEMPPGAKAEGRDLDNWTITVWGKSGGLNQNNLTIKGLVLFPEDEDGWTGITAKWFGMRTAGVIAHIGTNRWGHPYCQLFASDGTTFLGYADITGRIGTEAGDEKFVVLTGRDDGAGHLIMDLAQTFQLGWQITPRSHWEWTELPIP